ncbi:uncharacterized protein LOC106378832 [Brassica napus]|uniref:uncharacterized protein LOC106378832 n=1 Tax=Brassica napus TaxID=3708 RepID=UPI002078D18A|nr:uncharacterized protein LOC106378832 [Brassica napus]
MSAEFGPSVPFPHIGDNVTTCMRKGFEPSPAIYDPLGPVDPVKRDNLLQHLKPHEKIPHGEAHEDIEFYRILITPRPWPIKEYGWLVQNSLQSKVQTRSQPFWSKRVAFIDSWFLESWVRDYKQFEVKPEMVKFKGSGYEGLSNGLIPTDIQTKLRWFTDVDHLYGVINTGGNHWVAFHADLHKEKVDCYDSIVGEQTLESDLRMLNFFGPLTRILPAILNALIPDDIRVPTKKEFVFRRRTKRMFHKTT